MGLSRNVCIAIANEDRVNQLMNVVSLLVCCSYLAFVVLLALLV